MDINDFIENGTITPNPYYKKGEAAKLTKSIKPGKTTNVNFKAINQFNASDEIGDAEDYASNVGKTLAENSYGLTYLNNDTNKYSKYGVTVNPVNTEQELQQARGENQSTLEQTGHAIVQAVGNEAILGSALAVSNLIDFGINLTTEKGKDDYTNSVSTGIENIQNDIKNRFDIYQKDPNQTWAVGDFGWWAQNSISVASTVSLMLPALGATKVTTVLGDLLGANKLTRGLAKVAKWAGVTETPENFANMLNEGSKIGLTSVFSRTMENYQEARDTYKNVYNDALTKINSFTPEQHQKLIDNNPQFADKSNEDIAKYMASSSADETFKNDYAMLLMDMVQFKALSSMWKGVASKDATIGLRYFNKKAASSLLGDAEETALNNNKSWLTKEIAKHPIEALAATWTEGIEEGFQAIQQDKGKEVTEKMFDAGYNTKTMKDYLQDPSVWEQAFWGIIGGITFEGAGNVIGNISKKIKGSIDKNTMSEEDYAKTQLIDEKIRKTEIEGRKARLQNFVDNMNLVNAGQDPFHQKIDPITMQPVIEDGSPVNETLTTEQQNTIKENLINDLVTNMTLDAVDAGNYKLLKEYITSPEFDKYFEQVGINNTTGDKLFSKHLVDKMDSVYEDYNKSLYDTIHSIDIDNPNILTALGRSIARRKLNINDINENINSITNALHKDIGDEISTDYYDNIAKHNYVEETLNKINDTENKITKSFNDGTISKQAYNQYIIDLNNRKTQLLKFATEKTSFGKIKDITSILSNFEKTKDINSFINEYYNYAFSNIHQADIYDLKNSTRELLNKKIQLEDSAHNLEYSIPKNKKDFKREYDEITTVLDKRVINKYYKAADNVTSWLEKQDDLNSAIDHLYNNDIPELKNDLDLLKLGHHSTERYAKYINTTVQEIIKDRQAKEAASKVTTTDGNSNTSNINTTTVNDLNGIVDSSTGNHIDANISDTSNVSDTNTSEKNVDLSNITINDTNIINDTTVPITEDEININTALLDKIISRNSIIQNENDFIINTDEQAGGIASNIVFSLYKESKNLFDDIQGKDYTSAEFNRLVDIIAEKLFIEGVSIGITRQAAVTGLKLSLSVIGRRRSINSFVTLAESLASKQYIEYNEKNKDTNEYFAITNIIPDNELNPIIESFIEAYIKQNHIITSSNKTTIDISDLFNTLLENNDINYEQAKYIFRNISEYIINNNNNKYLFINTRLIKNNIKNADTFFQQLIEYRKTTKPIADYMHIGVSTKLSDDGKNIINSLNNGDTVTIKKIGNSLSFNKNNIEIGYLGMVKMGKEGNSFQLITQSKGFVRNISKNSNGTFIDTFDDLFLPIINQIQDGNFNKIYDACELEYQRTQVRKDGSVLYTTITDDMVDIILKNPIISKKINEGKILFSKNIITNKQKALFIINNINNVLFYDATAKTKEQLIDSYNDWKVNTFNNYRNTLDIQNALLNNEEITVKVAGITEGKLLIDNVNHNINDLGFTYDKNPVIYVTNDNTIEIENIKYSYPNKARFGIGSMGMLIKNKADAPIIALFTDSNPLSSNRDMTNDVTNELKALFKGFYSHTISFDELGNSLSDLFGGPGIDNNNLFSGYAVIKTNDIISLNIKGKIGKYIITIYRNRKESDVAGTGIVYTSNGDKSLAITSINGNEKFINAVINEITSNLVFNRTFFAIRNKNNQNTISNKYLYKENGKIVINIGGRKQYYENFGHYILENNVFKTNQGKNEQGNYFDTTTEVKSIYINPSVIKSPVEGDAIDSTPEQIIKNATDLVPADTTTLLKTIGVSKDILDILNGNNEANIKLIPDSILYDSKTTRTNAIYKNKNVYITNIGITSISKSPKNAIRILMHEYFHSKIEDTSIFKKKNIIENLFETYTAFIDSINNDINVLDKNSEQYKLAKNILDNFINKNFTYETYGNNLNKKAATDWNNKTEEERKQQFVEEWLIESITQPVLIDYLNSVKYTKENVVVSTINNTNKSIWQKIIDVLLKLFGKTSDTIKDYTILAKQYKLLGEEINNSYNNNNIKDTNESNIKNDINISDNIDDIITIDSNQNINNLDKLKEDELFAVTDLLSTKNDNLNLSNYQKEQINTIFKQIPELSEIGSKEQYVKYISTIFPNSKVKGIVYHSTSAKYETFDMTKVKSGYGAYFSPYNHWLNKFIGNTKIAVVNIENPLFIKDDTYSVDGLNKKKKDITKTILNNNNHDGIIGYTNPAYYNGEFEKGYLDLMNDKSKAEIVVLNSNDIHFLGSKQDIEGFKEFINSDVTNDYSNTEYIDTFNNNNLHSPVGIVTTSDMSNFENRFQYKDRAPIKTMINENNLNFSCK